jgi:hypothetical protein
LLRRSELPLTGKGSKPIRSELLNRTTRFELMIILNSDAA